MLARTEGGDVYVGQVWPGARRSPTSRVQEVRDWWGEPQRRPRRLRGRRDLERHERAGDRAIPPDRMRFEAGAASHERFHNQYGAAHGDGDDTGLRAARPDLRPFVLSRAGFAGIQRYARKWMGDNVSRGSRPVDPDGPGLGLSGQPFVGADIGGFAGDTTPELLARWMQYGVLTPFVRNHSMSARSTSTLVVRPRSVDRVREAVRLRYRLMPYMYAAFVERGDGYARAAAAGVRPPVRPGARRDRRRVPARLPLVVAPWSSRA